MAEIQRRLNFLFRLIFADRDKRDIELKLNNRVELTFDLKYNIIDIDFD